MIVLFLISAGLQIALAGQASQALYQSDVFAALEKDDVNAIKALITNPPIYDFNQCLSNLTCPIHRADSLAMVKVLVEQAGADMNKQDDFDETLLHKAIRSGQPEVTDYLLEKGANVNLGDLDGRTALFYAVDRKDPSLVSKLISKGANVAVKDLDEKTALSQAASVGSAEVIQVILDTPEGKGTIDIGDNDGNTPLHVVAFKGRLDLCDLLIDNGANRESKNDDGDAPYDVALAGGFIHLYYDMKYWSEDWQPEEIFKLSNDTSTSSGNIQIYVSHIRSQPTFSSITPSDIQEATNRITYGNWSWKEDFGKLDLHLAVAKQTANQWDATVYPSIKERFEDLKTFGTTFLDIFDEISPRLKAIEEGKLDMEAIQKELDEYEADLKMDGVSSRRRTRRIERKRQELVAAQLDYDEGLNKIDALCEYADLNGEQYADRTTNTIQLLSVFTANLTTDKSNFLQDLAYLESVATTNRDKIPAFVTDFEQVYTDLDVQNHTLKNISAELTAAYDEIIKINGRVQSALIAEVTLESMRGLNYGVRHGVQLYGKNMIKNVGKFTGLKAMKNLNKGTKAMKFAKGMKTFGKVLGGLSFGMSIFSLVWSTVQRAQLEEQRDLISKKQDEFETAFNKYVELNSDLQQMVDEVKSIAMTTESKTEASLRVTTTMTLLEAALKEAELLKEQWQGVRRELGEIRRAAINGKAYTDEVKKDTFQYLHRSLKEMREKWHAITLMAIEIKAVLEVGMPAEGGN